MRKTLCGLLVVPLLMVTAVPGRGDDAGQVKATLDKALEAHGGEAKLARLQALTLRSKGTFHDQNQSNPFAATWQTQGLDKSRVSTTVEVRGYKNTEVRVVNGDKGWLKSGSDVARPFKPEELAEEKESLYFNYVTTLAPLKGKDFELTWLGETKDEEKPAVGIKVSSKGHRDIKLFFSKKSGLLVRAERPVKGDKEEYTESVTFSDYREADGIEVARKYVVKWDRWTLWETEISEAKAEEKLDEKTFSQP